MKTFPYFCSHSRRLGSVQTLTSPPLDRMLFRNHSWDTDGLQGEEPPQQHGRDRWNRLTSADPHAAGASTSWVPELRIAPGSLLPSTHSNHSSSSYLGHWGCWLELINNTNTCGSGCARHSNAHATKHTDLWCDWLGMLLLQLGTDLHITNLSDPGGNSLNLISDPKLHQSKPCPVHFSHCLGKKQGRNNRENRSHTGSNLQEHFSPKTSSISVSVLSQKGTVPDLELFNYFVLSLHSVSSTSVSMYWFQITLYIYLFIYIFIYNLYQNW